MVVTIVNVFLALSVLVAKETLTNACPIPVRPMARKNASSWSITTTAYVSLVGWDVLVRPRKTFAKVIHAKMEAYATTKKARIIVLVNPGSLDPIASSLAAPATAHLVPMAAPVSIMATALNLHASVPPEPREKRANKTPETNALIIPAKMDNALTALEIMIAPVNRSGKARTAIFMTKLAPVALTRPMDVTRLSMSTKKSKSALNTSAKSRLVITGATKSATPTFVVTMEAIAD